MSINYQIMCLQSETSQKRVLSAGKCDMTTNSNWNSETMQVVVTKKKVPYDLHKFEVFWDTNTEVYVQGSEIVKESPELTQWIKENDVWTDSVTDIKGQWDQVQTLALRREIYGDADIDNPLHVEGFTGLNPAVINLNAIHGKLGWHNQQVVEASRNRPTNMMIYYGYLRGFDSVWDNELNAKELARYGVMVFGNGLEDPDHADYTNTNIIISRIKALNPLSLIFGYAATTLAIGDFESKVDDWVTLGVHGIMMDEAGYDYGTNRADFNTRVEYVHSKGMLVMANSWNMDHIIGVVDDPSFLNSTYNSGEVASSLTENDWYLLESHPINTTAFSGTDGYQTKGDWVARAIKAKNHRVTFGLNLAACGIVNDGNPNGQDLFDFGYIAALMFSLEAFGISDVNYGASSGKGRWWIRPNVNGMGKVSWLNPSVQVDAVDSDIYWRYLEFGKLMIDFSSGAQLSNIEKW